MCTSDCYLCNADTLACPRHTWPCVAGRSRKLAPLAQVFYAVDWRHSSHMRKDQASAVEELSVVEDDHNHDAEVVERAMLRPAPASFHAQFERGVVEDARRLAGNLGAHMAAEVGDNQEPRIVDNTATHEVVVRNLAVEDIDCAEARRVIS